MTTTTVYQAALLQLAIGDRDGYRAPCARDLAASGPSASPMRAKGTAWLLALAPPAGPFPEAAVALGRRAAEEPALWPITLNTLVAVLYRAGRGEPAIAAIDAGIALRGDGCVPQDWAFLAMAHARLGHAEEARRSLGRLVAWRPTGYPSQAFEDIEIALLRRGAESAVPPDPAFPADPFAP